MRIVYLANAGEVHFNRWYSYFIRQGHDVHLVSGTASGQIGRLDAPGIKVHFVPELSWGNRHLSFAANALQLPRLLRRLRMLLGEIQPDIVHAHTLHPHGYWGAISGFHPLVVTPIGSDAIIMARKSRVYRAVASYVVRRADLVTGDSTLIGDSCREMGMRCPYELVHNGVDEEKFAPDPSALEKVRSRYGLPSGCPLVFCARAFKPLYNVDKIIRAIPLVLRHQPECRFLFASYVGRLGPSLQKLVHELDIASRVVFMGYLDPEQMRVHHAAASAFVSVPSSDSSPSSVYEAMASGVPAIISDLPWTRLAMRHAHNVFTVRDITEESIAGAILEVLENHELAGRIREEGRRTVLKHFSYQQNMGMMESHMRRLLYSPARS